MDAVVAARAVGWTAWVGCLTGAATAVLLAGQTALVDGQWSAFLPLAAFMALYGAPIGVGVGWVVGVPVVAVADVLRRHTSRWRGLASAMAGLGALVPAVVFFGAAPLSVLLAPAAAAGAWWGLGRVFGPPPVPDG